MRSPNGSETPWVDERLIDPAYCRDVRDAMRDAEAQLATIAGTNGDSIVAPTVRRTLSIGVPATVRAVVEARLREIQPLLAEHFAVPLAALQEPEFLLYRRGDFFRPHQDNSSDHRHGIDLRRRAVSVVLFLNAQSCLPEPDAYCGGELRLYTPRDPERPFIPIGGQPGRLVAFRSSTIHEVRPVTHGERYTVAAWFTQPSGT